ncbi:MAG: NupC/NupG family nucleoside CNT transporter [Brevinemataceae bacterium]
MKFTGIIGILVFLLIAFGFSKNRKAINWYTIAWGLGLQILFALIILGSPMVSFIMSSLLLFLIAIYLSYHKFSTFAGLMIRGLNNKISLPVYAVISVLKTALFIYVGYYFGAVKLTDGSYAFALDMPIKIIWGVFLLIWIVRSLCQSLPAWFKTAPINSGLFLLVMSLSLGSSIAVAEASNQEYGTMLFYMVELSKNVSTFLSIPVDAGASFMYGNLSDPSGPWGFIFFIKALSIVIFFSAFISVLYFFGIVQIIIDEISKFMRWTMNTSGAETLSCVSNIFVGQTEAPILIKPFIPSMTNSEIHAVMTGGFATIAGSVFAGFVAMGIDPSYLIGASIMSAPAALMISKMFYPETEVSETNGETEIPNVPISDNVIGAAAIGTSEGIQLALNIAGMLISFIALIELVNMGIRTINPDLSLELIFGYIFQYVALIMGVSKQDSILVGSLLGTKIAINEFVAYINLSKMLEQGQLSLKSQVIATYALCGFANFSSIAIQIAGISYMGPNRRSDIVKLGFSAMWAGVLASWTTASIVGMFV